MDILDLFSLFRQNWFELSDSKEDGLKCVACSTLQPLMVSQAARCRASQAPPGGQQQLGEKRAPNVKARRVTLINAGLSEFSAILHAVWGREGEGKCPNASPQLFTLQWFLLHIFTPPWWEKSVLLRRGWGLFPGVYDRPRAWLRLAIKLQQHSGTRENKCIN